MAIGTHLQELFTGEKWQDHFESLSDALVFTLSMYSAAGEAIYVPADANPLCKGFSSRSSELNALCRAACQPLRLRRA